MIQQLRYKLENLKGQRESLAMAQRFAINRIANLKEDAIHAEEARMAIQTVAQATQKQLEYHVSEIVTLALSSIFDSPYKLKLEFVQRRNKTEADLLFERGEDLFPPMSASGGGAVDVASFALRTAMWTLKKPQSRNTLILDEPLKFLSKDLMPRAAVMLNELSKKLNLQIIMVSHVPELIEGADKYFTVENKNGVSVVLENGQETIPVKRKRK